MNTNEKNQLRKPSNLPIVLWVIDFALLFGLMVARIVYPERMPLTIAACAGILCVTGYLIHLNRTSLRSRTTAFGLNSAITVALVFAILGVINYLAVRYPLKKDFTRNQIHTLSDQTRKVVQGLREEARAVHFSKPSGREQVRPLLDNLSDLSPKFKVEYVDPDKEPSRAKQAGVKKYGTLQLVYGARDSKIDEVTEEKLTNALIKLTKPKAQTLCAVVGHGEKSFTAADAEGYELARKALADQSYEVKDLNLVQEAKVPDTCDAIAIMGSTRAFFEAEIKILSEYLANGGRAVIGVDTNLKGPDYAPELYKTLEAWHIRANQALIVDPVSRAMGVDAAVPLLATFSKDSPITKDFPENCYFPFTRPLEVLPGAPTSLNVTWLAQTTQKAWGETSSQQIGTGAVSFDKGSDKEGPLTVAIAAEGKLKDSKAARSTRLVVFGNSLFANNNYSRYGGNLDFFLNSVSWLLEDESLISIRAKEEGPGRIELTQAAANLIGLLTIFALPGLIALAGVVVWYFRRRL